METARQEFLRIYRLEIAKTILVTIILVAMIMAGGILMQSRISLENEIRQQRVTILVDLDSQLRQQLDLLKKCGIIIEDLHRQIIVNQNKLDTQHKDIGRLILEVSVLGDLIRTQRK